MSESPLIPEPLYGLRTWRVIGAPGEERLAGPQKESSWPVGGEWLQAVCLEHPEHDAPAHDCACGIHGLHPTRAAARRVLASRRELPGVVEAAGRTELHADGFRAERARPYALLVRKRDNARLVERLAAAYGAEVVVVDDAGALLGWCRARGLGLEPSVVASLLGPDQLAATRRATARRRRLVALRIAAAAAVLGLLLAVGIAATGDPGDRPLNGRTGQVQQAR